MKMKLLDYFNNKKNENQWSFGPIFVTNNLVIELMN